MPCVEKRLLWMWSWGSRLQQRACYRPGSCPASGNYCMIWWRHLTFWDDQSRWCIQAPCLTMLYTSGCSLDVCFHFLTLISTTVNIIFIIHTFQGCSSAMVCLNNLANQKVFIINCDKLHFICGLFFYVLNYENLVNI